MSPVQLSVSNQDKGIGDILSLSRTYFHAPIKSKKKALEMISQSFSQMFDAKECELIYDKLVARERLGNTALGKGVALPHCRVPIVNEMLGCFLLLENPVDFDAPDKQKVDLIFALLVPEDCNEIYLKFLAKLAEGFQDSSLVNQLRLAPNHDILYATLCRM